MNKQRRKFISENINLLKEIKSNLEDILSEEESYFDNMPENLQGSLRGEEAETAIDILNEAIEDIENCTEKLNEII